MFSVVIPLYNKELSIGNTLQSVLNQTFQEFEIVIVNDGSTDKSVEVVESINDKRIRLVQQENQGVSAARNKGIEKANYEWIAFLDGDDLWKTNHLEEIIKMMDTYPKEKVYVTSFEFSDNREIYRHSREKTIFEIEDYFKEAINEYLIWTGIVVIHKDCFAKVGLFNKCLNRGEDLDLWARIAKEYQIIKSLRITGVYKLDSENKLTGNKSVLNKSMLSVISLKGLKGSERFYFKKMLIGRIKSNIRCFSLREVLFLVWRHKFELIK